MYVYIPIIIIIIYFLKKSVKSNIRHKNNFLSAYDNPPQHIIDRELNGLDDFVL